MNRLDDPAKIARIDRSNMLQKIDQMPEYLSEALAVFKEPVPLDPADINKVLLAGMGTSAVSAEIALNWLVDYVNIPVMLIRDNKLPRFADSRTLVEAISYSGETQETLEIMFEALRRKCLVMTISSGGKMRTAAEKLELPDIHVQGGLEPRTAFPFLFGAVSLSFTSLAERKDIAREIKEASNNLRDLRNRISWKVPHKENPAKQLAVNIADTIPALYAFRRSAGLARRLKNQLNENSKIPALLDILPEASHNDLEAWHMSEKKEQRFSHIFLRPDETEEEKTRIEETKKILAEIGITNIHEICGFGETRVSRLLSIVYFSDYLSFYLSILRKVDPTPWQIVQEIKRRILRNTQFNQRFEAELLKTSG